MKRATFVFICLSFAVSECAVGEEGIDASDAMRIDATDAPDIAIDTGADIAVDAGPVGDALPAHAVMFFSTNACPRGWSSFALAAGRFAMPTFRAQTQGTRGMPLAPGEDRTHAHTASVPFTVAAVSFAGAGGGNNGIGAATSVSVPLALGAASTGVPYVQLLACEKNDAAVAHAVPLPAGMRMFVNASTCPTGFTQPLESQGRMPIGLPAGGMNGATWGGAPVGSSDSIRHHHVTNAALMTHPFGIALASGCCGNGYARNDSYTATATSDLVDADLPTVHLLECEKN